MDDVEDNIEVQLLENNSLIETYKEVESFIKYIDEEIKKTDVGEKDEK